MKCIWWLRALVVAAMFAGALDTTAEAGGWKSRWYAQNYAWHHNYYDPAWTPQPHALVVPPTAHRHIEYNWGVTGTENLPIRHQFQRGYDPSFPGGGYFAPQPVAPTSTNQMGVYYIRGPW